MTPEGRVKAAVKRVLQKYGVDLYAYMPVPSGYGAVSIDFLVCYRGRFIAIETKAPGKEPTDLQKVTLRAMERAGAKTFVIDRADGTGELAAFLEELT